MAVLDTGTADAVYQAYRTGENEAEVVVLLTDQVNSFLDQVTFGRVMGPLDDDVQGKVDQCANELLAFLIRERVEPETQSETVGDWSRTFAHVSRSTPRQEMYRIACRWLAGTGLMYCGV